MKQTILLISIVAAMILLGCKNEVGRQEQSEQDGQTEKLKIHPTDELRQVDELLSAIADAPQRFTAPSDKATKVRGTKGTLIHLEPGRLETVDGSPLGDSIEIELLEITDKSGLVLNNAQTVSNGQILVTGGAYYLNMTSGGKQLRIKRGKGIEVEFPKLTENEMELFLGERDSLGQINWIRTNAKFKTKAKSDAKKTEEANAEETTEAVLDSSAFFGDSIAAQEGTRREVSEEYLRKEKKYIALKKEIERQRKTYEAVELMNFGWINCDRFFYDPKPKTNIQLFVDNDWWTVAKVFVIFKDINGVMADIYWKGRKKPFVFRGIPVGSEVILIALSVKDETPYLFDETVHVEANQQVQIEFEETTRADIKKRIASLTMLY